MWMMTNSEKEGNSCGYLGRQKDAVIPPSLYGLVWHSEKSLSFTSCWEGWVQAGWSFLCQMLGCVKSSEKDRETEEAWMDLDGSRGYSSVQFSSVLSDSLRPHGLQHARPPCLSPTPGVYSNSCALSQWCHPTISSSVTPFSSRLQSFPASGSFPMSQLFTSGGQSIGIPALTSVLPMNIQDWSPLGWTGWISLQSTGLSTVFSNTTVQKEGKAARVFLSCGPGGRVLTICLEPTGLACRVYLEIQSAGKPWESRWGIWQKSYGTIHPHTGEQRAGESVQSCFRKSKDNSIGGKRAQSS